MNKFLFYCAMLFVVASLNACIFETTGNLNVAKLQISLVVEEGSSISASIPKGFRQAVVATATLYNGSIKDVTEEVEWFSGDRNVVVFDGNKIVGEDLGQAVVFAELKGFRSNVLELEVSAAIPTKLQLTPASLVLPSGITRNYQALATFSDDSVLNVTDSVDWFISHAGIAALSNGVLAALSPGVVTLNVSLGNLESNESQVEVTSAELVSIQVSSVVLSIAKGTTNRYTAIGTYTDSSTQDISEQVSWISSELSIASVDKGLASGLAAGNSIISARLGDITSNSVDLAVTNAELTRIQITPPSSSIAKGLTQAYVATGTYTDNSTQDISTLVSWSSSEPSITTIVNSLATGLTAGSSVISASLSDVMSNTASLVVTDAELVSIQITPPISTIAKGLTQTYFATGTFTDNSTQDISGIVSWSSSDLDIATIVAGSASATETGSSVISASLNGIASNTANLTVTAEELIGIQITPPSSSIAKGLTQAYVATGIYTDNSTRDISGVVSWNSSDSHIATVVGGMVNTVATGNSAITASLNGIASNTANLTVTAEELLSISITPAAASSIAKGNTKSYVAMGVYTDNSSIDLSSTVSWNSSDVSVATIVNGLTTGVIEGSTTISANLNGISSDDVNLTVTAAELVSISVEALTDILVVSRSSTYIAMGTYSDGSTVDVSSSVVWLSSNTGLVSIVSGTATALASGNVDISASQGGVSSSTSSLEATAAVPECGLDSSAGPCIKVTLGLSGTALNRQFTNTPSLAVLNTMGYTIDNSVNNTGTTYSNTYDRSGIYSPIGEFARMKQSGSGLSQYARYCADLNTLAFNSKNNWRQTSVSELNDFYDDHNNVTQDKLYIVDGWSIFYGYWTDTPGGAGFQFKALWDGQQAASAATQARPVSCVSDP
ncbi:hypothetical protein AHAT_34330 [Agarivorans sp. Toyoura001]|uniref:Ig-like domain-containing protein n=1 Tax=Agarivorans sp. Toyoura001 TaxID=2283141 RepID=UPI0010E6A06F|nr:Ig-like domain-containing protein [Agarivorans sp. Toyoura001]GDY27543.1 hypothetical protein AHAT_34330 [Agarivorans sp. Toyoura001]